MKYFLLGFLGLIGVFSRYIINLIFISTSVRFPVGTLAINIIGSFLIGIIYEASSGRFSMSDDLRMAVMVGLLGGFTTFSAFSLDSITLIARGQYLSGSLYVFSSVGGGLVATALGLYIGKLVVSLG